MKKPIRWVMVDQGYDLAENWVQARVRDSREVAQLFCDVPIEELLVELPGGERTWVSSWREIP
jgi:hypothetical protein